MKSNTKRISLLSMSLAIGAAAFATLAPSVALAIAPDTLVTLCFRNRTIQVPSYIAPRYTSAGATPGPCGS